MADNHFSDIAKKGRYGDTEIARTSKGELWHVNPQEKSLMNMYGMEGERMVDAMGSGTINPKTGLEEKFDPLTWIAIGTALIGGYQAWKGGSSQKLAAQQEGKMASSGVEDVNKAEAANRQKRLKAEQATLLDLDLGTEKLAAQTGVSKEELLKGTSQAVQQSNVAYSGTIQEQSKTMWDRVSQAYGMGVDNLTATFGKRMGQIAGEYESEQARLRSERKRLGQTRDFAEERAGQWYLGKNIEESGFQVWKWS